MYFVMNEKLRKFIQKSKEIGIPVFLGYSFLHGSKIFNQSRVENTPPRSPIEQEQTPEATPGEQSSIADPEFLNSTITVTETPAKDSLERDIIKRTITVTPPNGGEAVTFEATDLKLKNSNGNLVPVKSQVEVIKNPDIPWKYRPVGYVVAVRKDELHQLALIDAIVEKPDGSYFKGTFARQYYNGLVPLTVDGADWESVPIDSLVAGLGKGMGIGLYIDEPASEAEIEGWYGGKSSCDSNPECVHAKENRTLLSSSSSFFTDFQDQKGNSQRVYSSRGFAANIKVKK